MAQPGTVIASCGCHDCKERVQIKLNKNYVAYYFCAACSASHRFNRQISAELDAKFERMYGKPSNDNEKPKSGNRVPAARQHTPAAESEFEEESATEADTSTKASTGSPATVKRQSTGTDTPTGSGTSEPAPAEPANDTGDGDGRDWFESHYG